MLLFLAAAFTSQFAQPPSAAATATATVRIEPAAIVGSEMWERLPEDARREVIVADEEGRALRLRLVDMP